MRAVLAEPPPPERHAAAALEEIEEINVD